MSTTHDELAGLDSENLRQRFVEMTLLHAKTQHVGRQNRIFGWCRAIEERLVAVGGASERELLPLLDHPSEVIRRSAAYAVRPFNRELFLTVMEQLVRAGGEIGRTVRHDLEFMKLREEFEARPPTPDPAPDPNWLRILDWQRDNPPPPAMRREQFEDRVLTEFSTERARQILALARSAIGLWPQREASSQSPLASRHCGAVLAPRDWDWPIYEEEPMYFLGQIHCPDLAGLPGAKLLPADGLLTFFGDFDAIAGCDMAGSTDQGAVYWWPTEDLLPIQPPLPLDAHPKESVATPLIFRPFIDLPHPSAKIVEALALSGEEQERYSNLRDALRQHGVPDDVAPHCDFTDKLLGWPDLVQDDFWLMAQTGADAYRLLAQLPARLGPGGSLYFFIRDADLAERRFDRAILDEQNT